MPIVRAKPLSNSTATWVAAAKAAGATHIWALNETSGMTATDQGSSPSNGTYVGSPVQAVAMRNQTGVLLNGSSQLVSLPTAEVPTSSPWSIECYAAFSPQSASTQIGYPLFAGHIQLREYFDQSNSYSQISTNVGVELFAYPAGATFSDGGGFYKDSSDNFFVANATANAIQKTPSGSAAFTTPYIPFTGAFGNLGIFDSSGNFYTSSSSTVYAYSAGNFTTPIWTVNTYHTPTCLAIDKTGTYLYVGQNDAFTYTTSPGYIQKYNAVTGAFVSTFLAGNTTNPFNAGQITIVNLAIDSSNNVFITDYSGSTATVLKYNSSGTYQTGIVPPTGNALMAVDMTGAVYFLGQNAAAPLYKYTNSLAFSSSQTITTTGNYSLTTDTSNNIFVGNQTSGPVYNIIKYNSSLVLQTTFNLGYYPYNLGTDSFGNIYSFYAAPLVTKLNSSFTIQNYAIGSLNGPFDVKFDSTGIMYIATSGGQFNKYSLAGAVTSCSGNSGQTRGFQLDSTGANAYIMYGGTSNAAPTTLGKVTTSTMVVGSTLALTSSNFAKSIALDSSNNVYVYFSTSGTIVKYPSTLASVTATYTAVAYALALTVDSSGNMYLLSSTNLYKYNSSGVLQSTTAIPPILVSNGINVVLDSTATHAYFIGTYDGGNVGIIKMQIGVAGSNLVRKPTTLQPRHYVVTYNGTQYTVYVDATPIFSVAGTINTTNSPPVMSIGAMPFVTNKNPWQGSIANAAVYAAALTPAQISANYNAL